MPAVERSAARHACSGAGVVGVRILTNAEAALGPAHGALLAVRQAVAADEVLAEARAALAGRVARSPRFAARPARGELEVAALSAALAVLRALDAIGEAAGGAALAGETLAVTTAGEVFAAIRVAANRLAACARGLVAGLCAAVLVAVALEAVFEADVLGADVVPANLGAALRADGARGARDAAGDPAAHVLDALAGAGAAIGVGGAAGAPARAAGFGERVTARLPLEEAAAVLAPLAHAKAAHRRDVEAATRGGASIEASPIGERPQPELALAGWSARELGVDRLATRLDVVVEAAREHAAEDVDRILVVVGAQDGPAARHEEDAEDPRDTEEAPPRSTAHA